MVPELSIVIPVYRNAATLWELHERLTRVDKQKMDGYEILFVNDACPSDSLSVLRDIAERDPSVAVLALETNVGQNRAIMAGLGYARGKVVVVMDSDLQDAPEAIPRLLFALEGEVAAVFAGRRGHYESAPRLAASRIFKLGLSLLTRGRIPADAGLFLAMNREMVEHLLRFPDPDPYVIGLMGRSGLHLVSIPVERVPNPCKDSNYSGWMRLRLAWRAVKAVLRPRFALFPSGRGGVTTPAQVREFIGARFGEASGLHARKRESS